MSKKLSEDELFEEVDGLQIWSVVRNRLVTRIEFDSFKDAVFFSNMVFSLAEEYYHHPRVCVEFDAVEIDLWSHEEGGVTELDLDMAEEIEEKLGLFNQED